MVIVVAFLMGDRGLHRLPLRARHMSGCASHRPRLFPVPALPALFMNVSAAIANSLL